jgi:hypothetical protein
MRLHLNAGLPLVDEPGAMTDFRKPDRAFFALQHVQELQRFAQGGFAGPDRHAGLEVTGVW